MFIDQGVAVSAILSRKVITITIAKSCFITTNHQY